MKKLFEKIKEWFLNLNQRYYIAFIIGMIVAAFIALVIPKFAEWCVVPIFFALAILEFVRQWQGKPTWWRYELATLIGGVIIWVFQLIGG